jgi:hypothetical protein
MDGSSPPPIARCCGNCRHFRNEPRQIEAAFQGLTSLSSGFASVRAQDGLCSLHGIYLSSWDGCPRFAPSGGEIDDARM